MKIHKKKTSGGSGGSGRVGGGGSGWAPGRFAPKPVPPGTIPPGLFAQNFERDRSLQSSGTIRSKTNLRVDSPIFIIYLYIY